MEELKSGRITTEFWLSCGFALIVALNHRLELNLSTEELAMIGLITGVYSGGRSFVKTKAIQKPKETVIFKEPV